MIKGIAKGLTAAGLGLALAANTAHAQKPGVELGVNLVSFASIDPDGGNKITGFNIGTASFGGVAPTSSPGITAAWYLSDMIAIEPQLGFGRISPDGSDATSFFNIQVGVPIYLKKGWGKAGGFFIDPYVGMFHASAGSTKQSQTHFGANVGTKMKLAGSNMVFWRAQVGYDLGQENTSDGVPKINTLSAGLGLSVYLH